MELPFYERYPEKYKTREGECVFSELAFVPEEHDKWLPQMYFPIAGSMKRFPRYKNKRTQDPYIKMFIDNNKDPESKDWGLPVPNEEASFKSLAKYAKDMQPLTKGEVNNMNKAWEMTAQHFGPYMSNSKIRTYEESKAKLDMHTSSGAPFNLLYPTKKELFENDPEIDHWLGEIDWNKFGEDPNYTFLFTNSLKEEIRPAEKIEDNSIRTFAASAVDGSLHGNRLFGDMNDKMNDSWLKSSSTVGWSPMGGNWDRLIRKLKTFKNGYALDESQYDSSLRAYLMWGCARFRWMCLDKQYQTPQNLLRFKTYYRNLVNSIIISPTGILIQKLTGNPSGSCNTINDNTLILYTLMGYAWLTLCPEDFTSLAEFESNTAKALCGDDNTWTVSDWAHSFYNARSVISVWKTLGVTTTTDSLEPRCADELDYLSAHTVYIDGKAVPQYDRSKIMTSLLYSNRMKQVPSTALLRTAGMLQIGFADIRLKKYLRQIINFLLLKFDDICSEDQDWIIAKCCILSDDRLYNLWLGKSFVINGQSIEKASKDSKSSINKMDWEPIRKHANFKNAAKLFANPAGGAAEIAFDVAKDLMNKNSAPREKVRKPNKNNMQSMQQFKQKQNKNRAPRKARGRKPKNQNRKLPRKPRRRNGERRLTGKGNSRNNQNQSLTRAVIIEEDEYVAEVTSSSVAGVFSVSQYPVNIGQSLTFPWGSKVAQNNYNKYQFERLEFYYKREVSEFAAAGAGGKVIMSFNVDAADGPPANKQVAEDTFPRADGLTSENIRLVIPSAMLRKWTDGYFIRAGPLPGRTDIKTYDVGSFSVSTVGVTPVNTVLGELRVKYRCRLMVPILQQANFTAPNSSVYQVQNSGTQVLTTGVNSAVAFPKTSSTAFWTTSTSMGIISSFGGTSFNLPQGNWLMMYRITGTDSVSETFQVSADFAVSGANFSAPNGPVQEGNGAAVLPYSLTVNQTAFISAPLGGAVISVRCILTGAAGTLTITGAELQIMAV